MKLRILEVITQHLEDHEYPPSFREIRDLAGLSSTSQVSYWLDRLERDGLIERDHGKARAIRVVRRD